MHLNDLSWVLPPEKAIRTFKKGQEVHALILAIDADRERISLGMKQLDYDPFEAFIIEHPKGTKINGKIVEIDARRVIIELPNGLQGSIKRTDLSDTIVIGDLAEAYIASSERKNILIQLSMQAEVSFAANPAPVIRKSTGPTQSGEKAAATIGDLMRDQLTKRDDN